MEGKVYGYARVSSKDQNLDWQLDAFEAFGVLKEAIFADKASGKDFERPEYRRLCLCQAGNEQSGTRNLSSLADAPG